MAGYDPKRPRPAAGSDDPAPVDALLGDDTASADTASTDAAPAEVTAITDDTAADVIAEAVADETPREPKAAHEPEIAPVLSINGSARHGADVPVAPAPEEGTLNRAVLIGAVVALVAAVVALVALRRRSTRRSD